MTKLIFCNDDYRAQGCQIAPHSHNCNELILYGDTAQGDTEINGVNYHFLPASVALVRQGVIHSENHLQGTRVIFLGFETSSRIPEGVWEDMEHVIPLFYDIVEEIRNQEWGYEKVIFLKIQEILAYIERRCSGEGSTVKNLAYCKRYIEENYMQNISVNELAKMTCYSRDRFRHLFAEEFGISPQNYLISMRLANAERMLRTTKLSCMDIAQMCGFSDSGQMTKMVRKKTGRTPGELRRLKEDAEIK